MSDPIHSCYYCETVEEDLRPYGPSGAMVCHPCAMETPERRQEAEKQFRLQREAADEVVLIGEPMTTIRAPIGIDT